ncbi:sulfatase family protein [Aestuariibaculum marinum]|uniref:Sulfatase n=1 Tax=Aestuariibaculum marinum TaxID=2683592 RepID=A0A8J6U649_9FLAO|nr:sulfatase [Aestuariibaculum marinum]MBD0825460.1 sulfatase [Aestuariibaculum marinum]
MNFYKAFSLASLTLSFVLNINAQVSNKTSKQVENPNIVIIFMDDMGYGDLSLNGAIDYKTPNIDSMANEGMVFTNFYAAQAVCSASRAGLLTGCYPNRVGIHGALRPNSKVGLNQNENTIAEVVKENGYATAIFGKWHLGDAEEFLPLQHGFDEFFGLPYSNDMWPVDYAGNPKEDAKYPPLPLILNNKANTYVKTLEDQAQLTTLYTNKAVEFIQKNKNNPFLLYLPHSMPHVPIAVSSKFKGKSKQGLYGDLMMEIDWSVGEVLKALKENGLEENTLVIFTSDNGPWLNYGNHAGSTGGLREGKGTSWEGGQREPCLMKWPNIIEKGSLTNNIASTIDLLPTIAEITKGSLPKHKIDGVSLLPLLKGDVKANPRNHMFYYYGKNNLEAVRKDNWKLVFPHTHRSYENNLPGNNGFPGKVEKIQVKEMKLYNLRRDPGERYNVISLYPEVVNEIKELAELAREDLGDNLTNRNGKNNREPGQVK